MNKPYVAEQINARKNGLAPSQLNRQKTPIWGVGLADGQAPTSLTHPLTWRLYHHDALLTLADYEALDTQGFVLEECHLVSNVFFCFPPSNSRS